MTRKPVVFLFSGQGSQYYQMGRGLYDSQSVFRNWMNRLDEIASPKIGQSIVSYLYDSQRSPSDPFERILFNHPALFMVEYSLAQAVMDLGIQPNYLIGASMGEFVAAAVSGAISAEDAISVLIEQARLFEEKLPSGGMLAILADVQLYDNTPEIHQNAELAGIHYNSHFVVSGRSDRLDSIETYLRDRNIIFLRLPVGFAFHSSEIDFIQNPFEKLHDKVSFGKPSIPIRSCATGEMLDRVDPSHLWTVIREPVRFKEIIETIKLRNETVFIDLGPTGTLANFLKCILTAEARTNIISVMSPYGAGADNLNVLKYLQSDCVEEFRLKEREMLAFVFPGQGSQRKGMGESLFDEFPEFTEKADTILGYSIKELCLNDPQEQLGQTQFTQPALYVVNALSYLKHKKDNGITPDFVAGHSLGEYNALLAADVFDFETGLKLVQKRGELMSRAHGGGMAAVVGLSVDDIEAVIRDNHLDDITVANYNTPTQIVIAGPKDSVARTEDLFTSKGAMLFRMLNVSGAFHTPFMESAEKEFRSFVETFEFSPPSISVLSNVTGRPHNAQTIKETIVKQITSSVQWTDCIRYMMGKGVREFTEIGTGNVLTGLIAKIQAEASPLIIEDEPNENVPALDETSAAAEEKQGVITAETLGNQSFKRDFNLKYAYVTGGMYAGIASKEIVAKVGKAGMLGFFGTGGLEPKRVEEVIQYLKREANGYAYGMNLLGNPMEDALVDLFLQFGIKYIEAAAYIQITPALVKYRLKGLRKDASGGVVSDHIIIAKISRPEVAAHFLSPSPETIVKKLLEEGSVTTEQAELSRNYPMADHLCAEADSGGHTDGESAFALLPSIMKLRDTLTQQYGYKKTVCVGAAGGIGTPDAAAAAFVLGADFILTGSINQCTVEAGTSDAVKDLLQDINVQDTDYAPAGDMFEWGAKVQVLRKGVFFPARANKLYALYRQFNSLDEIDAETKTQIQDRYFKRSFTDVYEDVKAYYPKEEIEKAEANPKYKMALIFRWYFGHSSQLALNGVRERQVDFQVHCGPALGAFNQWVKGTELELWRNRHADEIAKKMMEETAALLNRRFGELTRK